MHEFNISTWTTRASGHEDSVQRILSAALAAVDPYQAVSQSIHRDQGLIKIQGQTIPLDEIDRIFVIGVGKAAFRMVQAAIDVLEDHIFAAIILTKDGYTQDLVLPGCQIYTASHPVPDDRGIQATKKIISLFDQPTSRDLILVLISGGASALFCLPVPGVNLEDLQSLTRSLLACGANIQEINTLRKHLDQVKGGGLAGFAFPAQVFSLVVSDVAGDPVDVIASGPTVPDGSTFLEAFTVLEKYHLLTETPQSILDYLRTGLDHRLSETPKPGDKIFKSVHIGIIASNSHAAQASLAQAKQEGFNSYMLPKNLQGEAVNAGNFLASIAHQVHSTGKPVPRPACIIAGGETTVTLHGNGLGGRNQEMALAALTPLSEMSRTLLVCLATDGGDGPTDAAGAVVSGESLARAARQGLDPAAFLAKNDSYHFFQPLEDLLLPGPTMTNVNDLAFLFLF